MTKGRQADRERKPAVEWSIVLGLLALGLGGCSAFVMAAAGRREKQRSIVAIALVVLSFLLLFGG